MNLSKAVDCVIVGGSYSGLSAALTLGRSLRNTIVIDDGRPCNRFTPHSQNFLTQDGAVPGEIARVGKQQILDKYDTVEFHKGRVVSVLPDESDDPSAGPPTTFQVKSDAGTTWQASKVILSTGIRDIFPDIPGFEACWGKSIIHCPYCHGYEFSKEPTGLFMPVEAAKHMGPLIRNLTPHVSVFAKGGEEWDKEDVAMFKANGISFVEGKVLEFQHVDGQLTGVLVEDDSGGSKVISMKAIYAAIPFELNARSAIEELGCEITEQGYVQVDEMQHTTVPGVFARGDATTMMRAVANAVKAGNTAGSVINMELAMEEFSARAQA